MPEIPPQAAQAGARVPVEVLDAASDHDLAHRPYGGGWTRVYVEQIRRLLDGLAAQGYMLVREPATDGLPATTPQTAPQSTETDATGVPRVVGSKDDGTTVETLTALRERYREAILSAYDVRQPLDGRLDERLVAAVLAVRDHVVADLCDQLVLNEMRGDHYAERAHQAEAAIAARTAELQRAEAAVWRVREWVEALRRQTGGQGMAAYVFATVIRLLDQPATQEQAGVTCLYPCDDDCDIDCHQEHEPSWKRDPAECARCRTERTTRA